MLWGDNMKKNGIKENRVQKQGIRICIIGSFKNDKKNIDGQTVKTREVYNFLRKKGFLVSSVDTVSIRKKPLTIFPHIKNGVKNSDVIILIVSQNGYRFVSPYLAKLCKRLNKRLYDFVIGGTRYQLFDRHPFYKRISSKFDGIYVETERIKKEYEKRGVKNVAVIPNYKDLERYSPKKDLIHRNEVHTCIFSRITGVKGISEAIDGIMKINNKDNKLSYFLDIYGRVEEDFKDEFEQLLKKYGNFISYKGVVEPEEASKTIHEYDILLFPTYWSGEGFPGTLIDAFFAAVPIVATDWNDNFGILEDGKNGVKINIKSSEEIANAVDKLVHDKKLFRNMSRANYDKASEYVPEEAMKIFISELGVGNEKRK